MKYALIACAVLLAGCQTASYGLQTYSSLRPVIFDSQITGKTYRVRDIPDEQKLLITPSLGDLATMGAAKGATFGIANAEPAGTVFQTVAMEYVASTGRSCSPTLTQPVATAQYEVRYDCQSSSVIPPA